MIKLLKIAFLEYFAPLKKYTKLDFLLQLSNLAWIIVAVRSESYFIAAVFGALFAVNEHLMTIRYRIRTRQDQDPEN